MKGMRGVILAGGTGSRLLPLTKVVNKHLLPINDRPMIQHSIDKLVEAGITDIMIITGGEHLGGIAEFLGSGKEFHCDFTYRVQDRAGGIAEALGLCRDFVGNGEVCVILGDNVFQNSLRPLVSQYYINKAAGMGAMNILKEVPDPERFGVAEISFQVKNSNGDWVDAQLSEDIDAVKRNYKMIPTRYRIVVKGIEEKPKEPKSNWAVTGIYMYDREVFDIVDKQEYSGRGELEITDVNNEYIKRGKMGCAFFDGWWSDAGTHPSYAQANRLARGE
jgi:glucose-1-phosphate thymidylyltransferase